MKVAIEVWVNMTVLSFAGTYPWGVSGREPYALARGLCSAAIPRLRAGGLPACSGGPRGLELGKEWRIRRAHLDRRIEDRRGSAQHAPTGGLWHPSGGEE